jgi:hypothetical protein
LGYRRCPRCGDGFPETSDYFYVRPGNGQAEYCLEGTGNGCHERYWRAVADRRREQQRIARDAYHARMRVPAEARRAQVRARRVRAVTAGLTLRDPRFSTEGRRFGVEIETGSTDRNAIVAALRAEGLAATMSHETRQGHWYVKMEHCGSELVSPPVSGEDGREQVRRACHALRTAGAMVNHACGLHVHHEVDGLSLDQFKRLFGLWHDYHGLIQQLVSPSRRSSSWCVPITREYVNTINAIQELTAEGVRRGINRGACYERYHSINVRAYPVHGTVEIRLHQGTHDANKIIAWTEFVQALIVAAGDPSSLSPPELMPDVHALLVELTSYGLSREQSAYLSRRAETLARGSRPRVPATA